MVRLSTFHLEEFSTGLMERKTEELCRGYCAECNQYTSEWMPYNEAMAEFIDHRYEQHRKPEASEQYR